VSPEGGRQLALAVTDVRRNRPGRQGRQLADEGRELADRVRPSLTDKEALKAFDAATGQLLWMSPLAPAASIGSGVAVAGHSVVANHYGVIAAYRLPQ